MPAPEPDPDWDPYYFGGHGDDFLGVRSLPGAVNMTDKFQWITTGWNCPVCNVMSNRVYEYAYWASTVLPGFHPHCDCKLKKVDNSTQESNRDLYGVDVITFHLDHRWPSTYNFNQIQQLADEYMKLYMEKYGDGVYRDGQTGKLESVFRDIINFYRIAYADERNKGQTTTTAISLFTGKLVMRLFQYPGSMVQSPNFSFFTLAGSFAVNMANLLKENKLRLPRAYTPWEIYQGPMRRSTQ